MPRERPQRPPTAEEKQQARKALREQADAWLAEVDSALEENTAGSNSQ